MNSQVYVGLAATSHDNTALSAASYDRIAVELPGSVGFLASTSSVSAPTDGGGVGVPAGVRLKRGAGAGWVTPPSST